MIRRIYAEKKPPYACEAAELFREISAGGKISSVKNIRILYRYDFDADDPSAVAAALSDNTTAAMERADLSGARIFAAEPAEGEPDEAAEALRCLLLAEGKVVGEVRSAKLYALYGDISEEDLSAIKELVFCGGRMREGSLSRILPAQKEEPVSWESEVVFGFRDLDMGGLDALLKKLGLDMGGSEIALVQDYFRSEYRDPTEMELTFFDAFFRLRPVVLSSEIEVRGGGAIGEAIGALLSARGELGREGPLTAGALETLPAQLIKSRSPAASRTSIDPPFSLSARRPLWKPSYGAIRLHAVSEAEKTPAQRREQALLDRREAARLAMDKVAVGEVAGIGAAQGGKTELGAYLTPCLEETPQSPVPGDKIVLVGGRGLRAESALYPLLRREAGRSIKCGSTLYAGIAVSAAMLAEGVDLDLAAVAMWSGKEALQALFSPRDGAAVVVGAREVEGFVRLLEEEGLFAAIVATVAEVPRFIMREGGKIAANLSAAFLRDGGAKGHITIGERAPAMPAKPCPADFAAGMRAVASGANRSPKGVFERYDHALSCRATLAPFGGKYFASPAQASIMRLSEGEAAYLAWDGDRILTEESPFHGAYLAVVESVTKLIAAGAALEDIRLLLHGMFARGGEGDFGKKMCEALLGACKAQLDLGVPALGTEHTVLSGKGSALVCSFAAASGLERDASSPEFKGAGHRVVLLAPSYDENGLPVPHSLIKNCKIVTALKRADKALAVYALGSGGVAEGVLKCCLGNEIGFRFSDMVSMESVFGYQFGAFILELNDETDVGVEIGRTTLSETVARGLDLCPLVVLKDLFEGRPASDPDRSGERNASAENVTYLKKNAHICPSRCEKPLALVPVFQGQTGAEDAAAAFERAGAKVERFPVEIRRAEDLAQCRAALAQRIRESGIFFLADGIEGDHVCGLSRFIVKFMQDDAIAEALFDLTSGRGGLIGGEGVGFGALLGLGLLPGGKVSLPADDAPAFSSGESAFRIATVRVASADSPWLAGVNAGDSFRIPVCGGGRFFCSAERARTLAERGQIMTQFADREGNAMADMRSDPALNPFAVEGLLSTDGKIFGRMGRSSAAVGGLYRNIPGAFNMKLFESAVKYFRK